MAALSVWAADTLPSRRPARPPNKKGAAPRGVVQSPVAAPTQQCYVQCLYSIARRAVSTGTTAARACPAATLSPQCGKLGRMHTAQAALIPTTVQQARLVNDAPVRMRGVEQGALEGADALGVAAHVHSRGWFQP